MDNTNDFKVEIGLDPPRIWTDEELSAYKEYALAHHNSRTPEQKAKIKELAERYRKEDENGISVRVKWPFR